jgi:peptidoglycan/LPS O-acetylase OafA/YrhL
MILDSPILTEMILPFLLVFVLIFAILQKSEILGKGKSQMDSLIALVVGLILIAFPAPRDIIVNLMPWLGVGAVALLVFFLLYAFVGGKSAIGQKWQKIVFGILIGVFVLGVLAYVTGSWESISDFFSSSDDIWSNILFVVIIAGVLTIAISTGGKSGSGESKKEEE